MNRLMIALILCFSIFQSLAQTQQPSVESVETMLRLTKAEALTDSMYAGMDDMMKQMITQSLGNKKLTAAQQRALDQLPAKIVLSMKEDFKWETMRPIYIKMYRETFTQNEVDAMNAFYQTPTGQAMIEKMPVVMQKSMQLTQDMMAKSMPRFMQIIEENMKEVLRTK
jgi:uncharacterized protein